jgi:hypothetical protein
LSKLRCQRPIRFSIGVPLTRDETRASYAIIRHNVRTYVSDGVVAVVRGKEAAEATVKNFEEGQSSEDRWTGWRYFVEKTEIKPGTDPEQATNLRQNELESRESKALEEPTSVMPDFRPARS